MSDHVVEQLVVDSGGFIRDAPLRALDHVDCNDVFVLQNIGENLYTLRDVVTEIRDKATRQRLQVLPYQPKFREPSTEAIRVVSEFAKKTGDYRSLSATDIRVIALTYMLEKEFVGESHIKTVPERKAVWTQTKKTLDKATDVAGFYLGPKKVDQQRSRNTTECSNVDDDVIPSRETDAHDAEEIRNLESTEKAVTAPLNENSKSKNTAVSLNDGIEGNKDSDNSLRKTVEGESLDSERKSSCSETRTDADKDLESDRSDLDVETRLGDGDVVPDEDMLEESDSESDDDDDDDDGWITPQNIASVKKTMKNTNEEERKVTVGCLTMDFAMQNVLLQMGLNVISVDGMLIKRTKNYVLRCYACNKIATRMTLEFCPSCGNKTLRKVSMTVGADGSIQYFMSKRRAPTTRGMNQSLPAPKGGKHSQNPILFADQPLPQQKPPKKALGTTDVFDPDYDAKTSPFAINDVTSRAAQLGIKQRERQGQGNKKRHGKRR